MGFHVQFDFGRVMHIRNASLEELRDTSYVENVLLPKLGFNSEIVEQMPAVVRANPGGLLMWQVSCVCSGVYIRAWM